jgi:hypothetical protein
MSDACSRHVRSGLAFGAVGLAAAFFGAQPTAALPAGLQFTPVNMTNNDGMRYGEPEIAVNPQNPNNMVYYVMSNHLTYACEAASDPNCAIDPLSGAPVGEFTTPGWISTLVLVTFDRGKTWQDVTGNLNAIPAPTVVTDSTGTHTQVHTDLISRGDPMVTVDANGTFYIGWDAMNLGTIYLPPGYSFGGHVVCPITTPPPGCPVHGLLDGGIAVSKSTDGGLHWSTPQLTLTGVDRPWMTTDLSTGTVYEASSGTINSSMSTGDPLLPVFSAAPSDRYIVWSTDGVNWSTPVGLGGGGFSGGGGSTISAAQGVLAAAFHSTSNAACQYFLSAAATAPCTLFETWTGSGWSRHAVPGLANATGSIEVAANPLLPGTYTVAATDPTTTTFQVYVTSDGGNTWSGPTLVMDGSSGCPAGTSCKFKPWINYSPAGVLALGWRSANVSPGSSSTTNAGKSPSSARIKHAPPCDYRGCGVSLAGDEEDDVTAAVLTHGYTIWAAVSFDSGATFAQPLQVSQGASAPSDPLMLGGTDDTSFIGVSATDVVVGWGQWPNGTGSTGQPLNVQGLFAAIKIPAFSHNQ